MTSSERQITIAHRAVLAVASRAADVLAGYEGTGATLTYGDIASQIGIDLSAVEKTDLWLTFMALDAAVEFRGWQEVQQPGERKLFQKPMSVTEFQKMAESPVARSRRKRAVR